MLIEDDIKLDYSDVLIRPKRSTLSSRKDVHLERSFIFKHSRKEWTGVPIMAANMDGVGTAEIAKVLQAQKMFTCLHKFYKDADVYKPNDFKGVSYDSFAVSVGASQQEFDWFKALYEKTKRAVQFLCIDVANGYHERFVDRVEQYRETFPDLTIIAGNVVTGDMTAELILRGADIVKCGIGPGSVCTTRLKTGVGYPQLSAVMECADTAHGLDGHIIADGGCVTSGDVAKAFGGGADFVMLGGMLAGHDEGGGELIKSASKHGKTRIKFYGMSSDAANLRHFGGLKDYRASEGREVMIDYKGAVADTVQDILGGVRSACTYVGARRVKDLPKCTTFVRVNNTHNRIFENSAA